MNALVLKGNCIIMIITLNNHLSFKLILDDLSLNCFTVTAEWPWLRIQFDVFNLKLF